MIGFTAAAAVVGIGSMGYGLFQGSEGREQQEAGYRQMQQGAAIQAEAARQQAGISKEQAASSVEFAGKDRDLNILAAQQSVDASNASTALSKSSVQAQQEIEAQKRNAMELDARRNQLEIIRNQQRARALGLATATGAGSSKGSGLQGAYGQASGQTTVNLLGVQQNLEIGRNIFDQNENISANNIAMADLQNQYAIQQAANQTTKSNLTFQYAQINAGYQSRLADTQTLASQGAGQIAMGQAQVGMGQATAAQGQSFLNAGANIFSMGSNFAKLGGTDFGGLFGGSSTGNIFGGPTRSTYNIL